MVGLTNGEKTLRICITIYTQYRRVTYGRRTDRWTDILPRHTPRYAYVSHGKMYEADCFLEMFSNTGKSFSKLNTKRTYWHH